jgi:hypothetical protein
VAVRQQAKLEGWLKLEVAAHAGDDQSIATSTKI